MKFITFISIAFIVYFNPCYSQVPHPDWYFTITGCNHLILFPDSANVSSGGDALNSGDFIGVFYDSLGVPACASGMGLYDYAGIMWNDSNIAIPVWIDDGTSSGQDGILTGEIFRFKWWRAIDSSVIDLQIQYDPSFPNDSTAVCGGISGVASFSFEESDDIGIPSSGVTFSPCELSDAVEITVPLVNYDNKPALNFPVKYSIDGGINWVTEIYIKTLLPNATGYYTFAHTAGMSDPHPYMFIAVVNQPNDIDQSNDTFSFFVPVITLESFYLADGNELTLDAGTGFSSYLWSGGSTNQTLVVDLLGAYSVTVTFNNCIMTATTMVYSEGITESTNSIFRVYPNPASWLITIHQSEIVKYNVSLVEIYNLCGALLFKEDFDIRKPELTINVSQLEPGNYILQINRKFRYGFNVTR